MLLELSLALLIGILTGCFTGLFPGIHINLIAAFLLASIDKFSSLPAISLAVFIVSLSITHTFLDFIPSIFLGAPEDESFLSVLPGHRMLLEGRGYEASLIAMLGCLIGIPLVLIITPIFVITLPYLFEIIKGIVPFLLILASLYLIFREDLFFSAAVIFLLSGIIGYLTFNLPVKEPLMPLLTGLFGISTLILSQKKKTNIPQQKIIPLRSVSLTKSQIIKSSFSASLISPFCSFLPGIGSGHAAVISSEISEHNTNSFLFLIGVINIIVMSLSFVTAFSIQKGRTGSAAAVLEILKQISFSNLIVILITIIISSIIAFILGITLSRFATQIINKVNYSLLNILVIFTLIILSFIFSGLLGILILITATFLGIFCQLSNIKKINLMGSLILPSIIYYLT